ncbi:2OG-Fe(II) oxygenase [Bordetella genomosp. 13]|uniref:2OG-Fe(II) oxygenase n=1 Tax=Bordetella genomosp. 13 TaxID=463040 RepID=UPI00391F1293
MTLAELLHDRDNAALRARLQADGHAVLPRLFDAGQCQRLRDGIDAAYRIACLREDQFEPLACAEAPDAGHVLVLTVLLSDARDFSGGECVMTEQRPRLQSRPMVRRLQQGDALLMVVGVREVQGTHGPYRAILRHGVARVRAGVRWSAQRTYLRF